MMAENEVIFVMERLQRKVDVKLASWKADAHRLPLIVKGARQIGKTEAIEHFAQAAYAHVVEINFALQQEYRDIFDSGLTVDAIVQAISFHDPALVFEPHETLLFFDELQACPECAASLKSFALDGRYDVICSGSLMGISYQEIESNSVGYKEDYTMHPLDFEEFLWAKGYRAEQIESLYQHMAELTPLTPAEMAALGAAFREYLVLGGMPAVVWQFLTRGNYSGSCSRTTKKTSRNTQAALTKGASSPSIAKCRSSSARTTRNSRFPKSRTARGGASTSA